MLFDMAIFIPLNQFMKKTFQSLLGFVLGFIALTGCKKEGSISSEEQVYKTRLENLLQPTAPRPAWANELPESPKLHLNFNSFKEAYTYFSFLERKGPFTSTEIATRVADGGQGRIKTSSQAAFGTIVNYSASPQVASPVSGGAIGNATVVLQYNLSYQIGFIPATQF